MRPAPKKLTLDQRIAEAGGSSPATVMVVCGDMLRRSSHPSSARPEEMERALSALSVESAIEALASVDGASVEQALARAADQAFEAAFAEDEQERAPFARGAMDGLDSRDRVASMLAAASAKLDAARTSQADAAGLARAIEATRATIAEVDAKMQSKARALTGVNRERRAELAALDASERASAWWYASRSETSDDDLLAALGGVEGIDPKGAVVADLAASRLPERSALESSALRRVSLAQAREPERSYLEARARSSEPVARALAAADAPLEAEPEA